MNALHTNKSGYERLGADYTWDNKFSADLSFKIVVWIIHECGLYTVNYGTLFYGRSQNDGYFLASNNWNM